MLKPTDNNPLKRLKKGEINKPIIQQAYTENKKQENILYNKYKEIEERTEEKIIKKSLKQTFTIKHNKLFILKALATTQGRPISQLLDEALTLYLDNIDEQTKNKAKEKYDQIQNILKGV